ncbi:hypothetical protein BDW22DRAFT_1331315 [Trametopsis cervina]|nr:hypothetical protein BDW22DRAFT_1331315 [Trametopsis cervina]
MFSRKFFASVLLAISYASTTVAMPWPVSSKLATHQTREFNGLSVASFHPETTYETFADGIDHPLNKRATEDLEDASVSAVHARLGLSQDQVAFKSGYSGEAAHHGYVRQLVNGIPVANAVANVAFNNANKLVAFGSSFVKPKNVASATPIISVEQAISKAESALGGKYDQWPTSLEYVAKEDNSLKLAHVVQIRDDSKGLWVEAFVDAHNGDVIQLTDFVAKATYFVLPLSQEYPTAGFEFVTDPQDTDASPNGWHDAGSTLTTSGNNAVSFKDTDATATSVQSSDGTFDYETDLTQAPGVAINVDAARVNTFYVVNSIHDISYKYGFTETAFNFQNDNNGKGGKGNDRVTISSQQSSGTNNANFGTPPDGQSGHMNMFLWTFTNPRRDGDLENDIISHENTHGISNRLTGGGTGRCLQVGEAAGMGEGWSDAFADWLEQKTNTTVDYSMGQWVTNNQGGGPDGGIRTHPYSTDPAVNPLKYSSIGSLNESHDVGEVWANILHNVYAALVDAHGYSETAKTDPTGSEGNVIWLHLFMDGLALQPCNPKVIDARAAWIQADANRFGGANRCLLWKAFASRGLGPNAANFKDDFTVPDDC